MIINMLGLTYRRRFVDRLLLAIVVSSRRMSVHCICARFASLMLSMDVGSSRSRSRRLRRVTPSADTTFGWFVLLLRLASRTFSWWSCCFFFQAEDGIRDADVTGVQTCALPI